MAALAWWELILRLLLAAVLGGAVGYQREATDRPAGFRTHILVAVGAALFTLISFYPFDGAGRLATDPTRIAAQVVTGIGFLGAGTIIRRENLVIGLTTAASLWAIAAVGVAAGVGYYAAALGGTGIILATLTILKSFEKRFMASNGEKSVFIVAARGSEVLSEAIRRLVEMGISIEGAAIKPIEGGSEISISLERRAEVDEDELIAQLASIRDVERVGFAPQGSPERSRPR